MRLKVRVPRNVHAMKDDKPVYPILAVHGLTPETKDNNGKTYVVPGVIQSVTFQDDVRDYQYKCALKECGSAEFYIQGRNVNAGNSLPKQSNRNHNNFDFL